jgi:hypothetical protein
MLVVIAIIATLTAIAVPTMNKLGMFGRDPLTVAARQTLVILKAARIYAGANNVDTAVVYAVAERPDERTEDATDTYMVIDAIAMVRRLTPEELRIVTGNNENQMMALSGSEKGNLLPFVPVKGIDGVFQRLQKGAVIASYSGAAPPDPQLMPSITDWEDTAGFCAIRVLDKSLNTVTPRPNTAYHEIANPTDTFKDPMDPTNVLNPDYALSRFPAHVFKPSGIVQVPSNDMVKLKLYVVPDLTAPSDVRFLETGEPVPAEEIEIYSTIGRIQAAS